MTSPLGDAATAAAIASLCASVGSTQRSKVGLQSVNPGWLPQSLEMTSRPSLITTYSLLDKKSPRAAAARWKLPRGSAGSDGGGDGSKGKLGGDGGVVGGYGGEMHSP